MLNGVKRCAHTSNQPVLLFMSSSTTLLLVLSLVLAVLAVLLSLPSRSTGGVQYDPATGGLISYLTPKRTKELIAREASIAQREADVARREADLLGGSPGGIVIPTCAACPPPATTLEFMTITEHAYETSIINPPPATVTHTFTQVQEVTKEIEVVSPPPPPVAPIVPVVPVPDPRLEDVLNREARVSEREKDVGRREELIARREVDATHREQWIMEQLV